MPWNTKHKPGRISSREEPFYHHHFDTKKEAERNARRARKEGNRVSIRKSSKGPGFVNYYYH